MIFEFLISKAKLLFGVLAVLALLSYVGSAPGVSADSAPLQLAITSIIALTVGGSASILGMWVGRNPAAPSRNAKLMSVLIFAACLVGMVTSYLDAQEMVDQEKDLARIMETIREIAMSSGDTELVAVMERDFGVSIEIPEDAGDLGGSDTGAPAEDAVDVLSADEPADDGEAAPSDEDPSATDSQ